MVDAPACVICGGAEMMTPTRGYVCAGGCVGWEVESIQGNQGIHTLIAVVSFPMSESNARCTAESMRSAGILARVRKCTI
jgi:hypothetical protein